jgi:hypothetical protein
MTEIFLFYILAVWGFTHIVVSSKILENFRNWVLIRSEFFGYLLDCYQCFSFWASILFYFLFPDLIHIGCGFKIFNFSFSLDSVIYGFIGSGLISFLAVLISLIIKKSK